ncbi:MAG: AAA family ATPase [Pseudomonadota bacterium]
MSDVIILNGCSSSGKTTLATSIQQISKVPFQYIGLDQFRDGLPMAMRGLNAPPGSPGARGLNVVPEMTENGPQTHIVFGEHGDQVLSGMRHSVQAFTKLGLNVIVDDLFFKASYVQEYAQLLDIKKTWLVGVHCDLVEIERREASRVGRFPGTAAAHIEQLHAHVPNYDLEVWTNRDTPNVHAQQVLERLKTPPQALAVIRDLVTGESP